MNADYKPYSSYGIILSALQVRGADESSLAMYDIEYTDAAINDLQWFRKHEQNEILDGIDHQLRYEPIVETRNRKRMRLNDKAEWELRIGDFRVLYNVDAQVRIIEIQRIGEKRGNTFFFRGRKEDI